LAVDRKIGEALKKILNGVYIIGARQGERINGMTAVWVTRLSFKPQLVGVAIGHSRFTHPMIEESGVFSISVLGPGQVDLARHFGFKSGRDTDKFSGISHMTKVTGAPILKDALAYLDCKVVSQHETGDHTFFVGEVLDGAVCREGDAVVYRKEEIFRKA